jgi:hypothetical protein
LVGCDLPFFVADTDFVLERVDIVGVVDPVSDVGGQEQNNFETPTALWRKQLTSPPLSLQVPQSILQLTIAFGFTACQLLVDTMSPWLFTENPWDQSYA